MDVRHYREMNEGFRRPLIYHVGKDCGFFVELNYMINAMLYCLVHQLQFKIYSEDANFGTGTGWTEYFLPFCTEVHENFHRKYNFHCPPSWKRIIRRTIRERSPRFIAWKVKTIFMTAVGRIKAFHAYGQCVLLGQNVDAEPEKYYHLPALGIDGDYYHAFGILAKMVWRPQPDVIEYKAKVTPSLQLPSKYAGLQVRGGDKVSETRLIDSRKLMQALHPCVGDHIFVLTDDYRILEEVRKDFPQFNFHSLCLPEEKGYNHQAFCLKSPQEKKENIMRLLISVDLLLNSLSFAGSITTGPSVFVMKVRADEEAVIAVDCPKEELKSALTLTIDNRAVISQRSAF